MHHLIVISGSRDVRRRRFRGHVSIRSSHRRSRVKRRVYRTSFFCPPGCSLQILRRLMAPCGAHIRAGPVLAKASEGNGEVPLSRQGNGSLRGGAKNQPDNMNFSGFSKLWFIPNAPEFTRAPNSVKLHPSPPCFSIIKYSLNDCKVLKVLTYNPFHC